jgi:hypothetical protein
LRLESGSAVANAPVFLASRNPNVVGIQRLLDDALFSNSLGVPATRIHEIVKERLAVTADTAARLAKHFGGDAAS